MTKNKTTAFSLPQETLDRLARRTDSIRGSSKSGQLHQDLTDYYALLDFGTKSVKHKLTQNQAKAVLDVLNGHFHTPGDMANWAGSYRSGRGDVQSILAHELADGCDLDNLHVKWEIDRDKLLEAIDSLLPLEHAALIDWTKQTWNNHKEDGLWEKEIGQFLEDNKDA